MPTLVYCDRAPYRVLESPEVVLEKYAEALYFVQLTDASGASPSPVWLNVRDISSIVANSEPREPRGMTR